MLSEVQSKHLLELLTIGIISRIFPLKVDVERITSQTNCPLFMFSQRTKDRKKTIFETLYDYDHEVLVIFVLQQFL